MARGNRVRFRAAPHGIAALAAPLVLLHPKVLGIGVPSVIFGIGIPALVVVSLLLTVLRLPAAVRKAKGESEFGFTLPALHPIDEPLVFEADPRRPVFLPGLRILLVWRFTCGPFAEDLVVPLPPRGKGRGIGSFPRRGAWKGRPVLRIADIFGFFRWDCPLGRITEVCVPPARNFGSRSAQLGRPSATASAAPRHREDAEDRPERRPYVPGDDPRRLDWKHYARTGGLLVRVGEEGVPSRGRLWLQVLPPEVIGKVRRRDLLDAALILADEFVRGFAEGGQEVLARLPGEEAWTAPRSTDWLKRLARTEPGGIVPPAYPPSGEHLVVLRSTADSRSDEFLEEAGSRGCRVRPAGSALDTSATARISRLLRHWGAGEPALRRRLAELLIRGRPQWR